MGYLFTAAFLIIGIYLIFYAVKEYRFLLLPGIYFIILGIWWLIDELNTSIDLTNGVFGWVIRGVSAAVLIVTGVIYYFKYYKNKSGKK